MLTIEDSINGVEASMKASIPTVLMTHGSSDPILEKDKLTFVKNWKAMLYLLEEELAHD